MTLRRDYTQQLLRELARTEQLQAVQPVTTIEQRRGVIAAAAQALSRRGLASAKTELVNSALLELAKLLYAADEDGQPCHYDPPTRRILVALPWGSEGYKTWGLRASEARSLRKIMLDRTMLTEPFPLVDWDAECRSWLLNVRPYLSLGRAVLYLQTYPVSVQEWRAAAAATRSQWARKHFAE